MKNKAFLSLFFVLLSIATLRSQDYDGTIQIYAGGMAHMPNEKYTTTCGGFNAGFSVNSESGHLFMMDFVYGGGEAERDFKSSEGWFLHGDNIIHGQLFMDYGRMVRQWEHAQLFPFLGLGLTEYALTHDSDEEDYPNKIGFGINAGFCFDWIIARQSRGYMFNHGIRIKPYGTLSFYHGLKMVPAINLSICYVMGGDN